MGMRWLVAVGLVVVAAGCGKKEEAGCPPAKEIASSRVSREGSVWNVAITASFPQPPEEVFQAFRTPERGHDLMPDNVLKSEIVKEEGDVKVVDLVGKLDILPPGFKVQNIRTEYTYYPQEKRFTTKSIDFKLADITSEYKFAAAPDGKGTVLSFTQTSKDKAPMIVESLQKGALCETFATQVKIVNKILAGS